MCQEHAGVSVPLTPLHDKTCARVRVSRTKAQLEERVQRRRRGATLKRFRTWDVRSSDVK
ncbi:hypothetical protein CY34DRAFT_808287 [Suillus luteus UH-Slu-Lm8-n1]|uniref:Uncharacterized protein n=1 Tax=Suillus luteus UH-Slu-Lm8-n1 TaxID=930992 RepID=A0A0C9ZP76_9AGAM|nr:hypothetical protein CY34DRAFT_808287 [Suillus luteus UH-Slu-Lm8-n1]